MDGRNPRKGGVEAAPRQYPNELRERAQRLVAEALAEDPGMCLNQAVLRSGPRVRVNPDTLRGWCKQAAIDRGEHPGTTTGDTRRIKDLEREACEELLNAARRAYQDCTGQPLPAIDGTSTPPLGMSFHFDDADSMRSHYPRPTRLREPPRPQA